MGREREKHTHAHTRTHTHTVPKNNPPYTNTQTTELGTEKFDFGYELSIEVITTYFDVTVLQIANSL